MHRNGWYFEKYDSEYRLTRIGEKRLIYVYESAKVKKKTEHNGTAWQCLLNIQAGQVPKTWQLYLGITRKFIHI